MQPNNGNPPKNEPNSIALKKRVQSTLNFTSSDRATTIGLADVASNSRPNSARDSPVLENLPTNPDLNEPTLSSDNDDIKEMKSDLIASNSPPAEPKAKKVKITFRPQTSRTSIIRDKSKITRSYPGPLTPINFDLYDENIFELPENHSADKEPIALGFQVKPAPHLYDIMFILAFLMKFSQFAYVGHIGPQDIETGLCLNGEGSVSPLMDDLFCKLLTLVLNRRKPIVPSGMKNGISELKSQYIALGLPSEWRDDSSTRKMHSVPIDAKSEWVDPSKPPSAQEDNYEYAAPHEEQNPFLEPTFEAQGLAGISDPKNRLIMLRCLVLWSLTSCNAIKSYITELVNDQDIAGDRDTCYASRPILRGFDHTIELRKDIERKFPKKSKSSALSKNTPEPENGTRYIDPTSDPYSYPMFLRFNEFLVGDCGFHIGRFYLVRMADANGGGISGIDKMRQVARDPSGIKLSVPSSFKLYVEDVHGVLKNSLHRLAPEFNEGQEIEKDEKYDDSKHFYEVASNSVELYQFVRHLELKLGVSQSEGISILSMNCMAYKPVLYMYQYLSLIVPLLENFETISQRNGASGPRSSRKRNVNYNLTRASSIDTNYDDENIHEREADGDDSYDEAEVLSEEDEDEEEYTE